MAESREHRLLVLSLVTRMLEYDIAVLAAEAPGWRRPAVIGGRRPDVIGFYRVGGSVVAAEAKRGPELWSCQRQLEEMAQALPTTGPVGAGALLILGVPREWVAEAQELCAQIDAPRTAATVWSRYL